MSHTYKCSRCRTRNVWPKALAAYKRGRRCKACGYARFYVDKERVNRKACRCDGYHHPHRPDSPCCVSNPQHLANRARRAGASKIVIAALEIEGMFVNKAKVWRGRGLPF